MAIYSSVPPPAQQAASGVDVQAWTAEALQSLSISPSAVGTGVALAIPLGEEKEEQKAKVLKVRKEKDAVQGLKRDSLRTREKLRMGKEGSRRRQRWENDHLLHVPNAQPPLPSDWEPRPTYPVHSVPYYLAPLWDAGVRHRAEEVTSAKMASTLLRTGKATEAGRVPSELRLKLKKAKGAKSLLQDLEDEVRGFMQEWQGKSRELGKLAEDMDSEDEEIVFVGRNGTMSDEQRKTAEEELEREKLVFDSLVDDHGATFGRWLVHSIATYYGLTSRSVTVGDPARREAYVGIKMQTGGRRVEGLPTPLYGMV